MIEKIIEAKKLEVEGLKRSSFGPRKRPVRKLALDGPVNIIAELKRKSPSAGFIGEIDEARIAAYSRYARAISVLTDSAFFGGSYEFLDHVAGSTDLPVLCKDFVIDRKQIDRAYAAGADLVLLIARILTRAQLEMLYSHARDLGLSCLVEIHEREELDAIAGLDPDHGRRQRERPRHPRDRPGQGRPDALLRESPCEDSGKRHQIEARHRAYGQRQAPTAFSWERRS